MKILFCGDVVGRSGRNAIAENIEKIKQQHQIDFTIINCDNASGGFGINKNTYEEFIKLGADVLTGGDHIWDQSEITNFINESQYLLRPLNFPKSTPGNGVKIFTTRGQKKIMVIHLLGQVFIKYQVNCPFDAVKSIIENNVLGRDVDAIFVDFHAEATSEKMALAKFLDGKVSAVIGTHTHIPTNDCHVMKLGTAYQTDVGMCGDYDSVIGMDQDIPIKSFVYKRKFGKMKPAQGSGTLCGTIVEINNDGLAKSIFPIKIGGIIGD